MYFISVLGEKFWAGSFASWLAVIEAEARIDDFLAAHPEARRGDMNSMIDEMVGPIMTVEGSVATVKINGSLVKGNAGFGRLFGVLGYDDIKEAMLSAVEDRNVKSILLYVSSPGGMVAGVQETADFIRNVDTVKPVYAFTDAIMASAAYWLGSSAREVYNTPTSMVGSIGTLQVHRERAKMEEREGITTTVIRSGKYKALANPYEPLSDLAKEEIQSQVDYMDTQFVNYVADRRGVDPAEARKRMGQGREFIGTQAKDAGLVDGTLALSDLWPKIIKAGDNNAKKQTKPVATGAAASHNALSPTEGTRMKPNLTPEQLAQLAAGTKPEALGLSAEDLKSLQDFLASAQAAPQNTGLQAQVDLLRAELRTANSELAKAQVGLEAATAKATKLEADQGSLLKIARSSIGAMQIALGGSDTSATLTDDKVVAEHARLAEAFSTKFPTGRVTTPVASTETTPEATVQVDPMFAAALAVNKQRF